MPTIEHVPTAVQAVFLKAWVTSPDLDDRQLTHAVDAGFRIAMCGANTSEQVGSWPADPTLWDLRMGRCPTCARVVYGSFDRRA